MNSAAWAIAARAWRGLARPLRRLLVDTGSTRFIVGVSVLLLDDQRRVLLLEHRFWGRFRWGLPSGTARSGETPAAAAVREVYEETGLHVVIERQLEVSCRGRRLEVVLAGRSSGGPLRLQPREVLSGRFVAPDDLPEGLLPAHRRLIAHYLSGGELTAP